MTEFDLIVVGGGAVGCATALACARALPGIRLAVVDAAPAPPVVAQPAAADLSAVDVSTTELHATSPHVLALNLRSIAFLEHLGVDVLRLAGGACPFTALEAYDSDSSGAIRFLAAEAHVDHLGFVVSAPALAAALRQRALAVVSEWQDQSPLRALHAIGGQRWALRAGDHWLRAGLVIGADGAHSATRTLAGIATQSWDYGQSAVVALAAAEVPHGGVARQWFTPSGPLALLPMSPVDGGHLALVWSLERDRAAALADVSDAEFAANASRASEYALGALRLRGARVVRTLRQCRALTYSAPGVALVGDAAHAIHPLAGLGINLGMADALALAESLATAREAPLGDAMVLARYARARLPENLLVMGAMEAFVRGFGSRATPLAPLRATALKAVAHTAPAKRQLLAAALGARPGARGPFA